MTSAFASSDSLGDAVDDVGETSFDGFDVSHISHVRSDEEEEEEEAESTLTSKQQEMQKHHHTQQNDDQGNPVQNEGWFTSDDSSYDRFIRMQHSSSSTPPTHPPTTPLDLSSYRSTTLAEERAKLRERKSGIMQQQKQEPEAPIQPIPNPDASPSPTPKLSPHIPKLALSSILKKMPTTQPDNQVEQTHFNHPAVAIPSPSTITLTARPLLSSSSLASGSSTTRSRLTQFNTRLRAARKIQKWYRDHLACKSAKQELAARKIEIEGMNRRARGFDPRGEVGGKRLQFDDIEVAETAHTARGVDRKKSLAHLKEKIAARQGSMTARHASASPSRSRLFQPTSSSTLTQQSASPGSSPSSPSKRSKSVQRSPPATAENQTLSPTATASAIARRARFTASPLESSHLAAVESNRCYPLPPPRAMGALTAAVQGFLVRHQMAQERVKGLVRQIKDVAAMIDQVRQEQAANPSQGEHARYATFFLKSLRQQLAGLKGQLAAIFRQPALSNYAKKPIGVVSPSPSRIRFDHSTSPQHQLQPINASPEPSTAGGDGSATARPVSASVNMLKRKSQRRFLKKKDPVPLPDVSSTTTPTGSQTARPATAGPLRTSAVQRADDHHAVDESKDAGDLPTSRSFLKRKSKSIDPHKVDWSHIRPRISNKLEGYKAFPNSIYESATGREWNEHDHAAELGYASSSNLHSPTQSSLQRDRWNSRKSSIPVPSNGSQTSRERGEKDSSRRIFKPSGNSSSALPLVPNTDSAVPPLSPTAQSKSKKSRHIILEPKKMDLSKSVAYTGMWHIGMYVVLISFLC